ncbi:PQQ-binding-like beta-propeller repeat protein [Williamsia maris]|uniref:outer membrane protein assembly factor BamB family protein n=1 Tax=Williamsia maris TaxID=72806 RepID=UPI0020A5C097|nr:PQQ-binding-like beta-propeller repeat protein [Williamsia maris]
MILLVAVATIASATITWKVGRDHDQSREADRMRSLGFGVRPTPLWTLDVKRLTDEPGAVLLSAPETLDQTYGFGSVMDSPTHIIAAVARPEQPDLSTGPKVGDVTLVGIDRQNGSVDWRSPVGRVDHCTDRVAATVVGCWTDRRIAFVDTSNGRVLRTEETDFSISYVDIIDGTAFVDGLKDAGKRRTLIFTAAPVGSSVERFRRTIEVRGTDARVAEIRPSSNAFTVSDTVGGVPQYINTAYDLDSGAARFSADGDLRFVGNGMFLADSFARRTKFLLRGDGSRVTTLPGAATNAFASPITTDASFVPTIVGTAVHDPDTGARLWSDPVLEWNTSPQSTTRAVVGSVLVVASPVERALVGLEVRTGRRLWTTPWPNAYFVSDTATDGTHLIVGDNTGMHSVRVSDGRVLWNVRLPTVESTPPGISGTGDGDILVNGLRGNISVWRARKEPVS